MEKSLAFLSLKHHIPLFSLLLCEPLCPRSFAALSRCKAREVFGSSRSTAQSERGISSGHKADLRSCGPFWRAEIRPFGRSAVQKTKNVAAKVDDDDDDNDDGGQKKGLPEKKSKGQKRREALRAVDWGRDLASLSHSQLEKAVRWASLSEDVLDAAKLAKSIHRKARSGRRRQFNYLGSLLRDLEPEVIEMVIKASKNGEELDSPSVVPDDDLHEKQGDEYMQKNKMS